MDLQGIIDRDVTAAATTATTASSLFGAGGGRIAFGVTRLERLDRLRLVGVADGAWHHVAVTRSSSSGTLAIYIDGRRALDGPTGDVSYRDGRSGAPTIPTWSSGPKHSAGSRAPSCTGSTSSASRPFATQGVQPSQAALPADGSNRRPLPDEGSGHGARRRRRLEQRRR